MLNPTAELIRSGIATSSEALAAMRAARRHIEQQNVRIARLQSALEAILEYAEDNYNGPEDSQHGPYIAFARAGLGIT